MINSGIKTVWPETIQEANYNAEQALQALRRKFGK